MPRSWKPSLVLGLLLTLCSLPALAVEPIDRGGEHLVALSRAPFSPAQENLDKLFYRWESYEIDLPALESQARGTGHVILHAGGRVFDIELELSDLRAPGFKSVRQTVRGPVQERPTPVATFKGHLAGEPESDVRLLIRPDLFQGYIRTAQEWIFIDPLRKYDRSSAPSEIVLFDDDDVRPEAAGTCGTSELVHRAQDLIERPAHKALIAAPTLGRADIATEADFEYYSLYGANTNSQIEGILNQVDGIYRGELALTLRIVFESVWTTASQPYTSTDSLTLLNQFLTYWNANRTGVARDLAHLFTGKNMGGVVGRAYLAVTCSNPSNSYGLSRDYSLITKITAHEIGHNFSANHDDQVSPPGATCTGSGPLMCSSVQNSGTNTFSNRSKTDITAYVNNNGACLDRLGLTSYKILTSQTPDTLGAGTGYEAGNQFSSSQNGYITALRFWKASGETGTHVGRLWTNSGTPLASVTFMNETASGWQEQYLPFRVPVTAGTRYWVTYNENAWQSKTGCGLSSPITNGSLTAWTGAYSNANSSGIFPTNPSCSNFFADVYFTP
jgi:hypothetical protein